MMGTMVAQMPRNYFFASRAEIKAAVSSFFARSRREPLSPTPMDPHQAAVMIRALNMKISRYDKMAKKNRELSVMHLKDDDNQFWYGFLGRTAEIMGGIVFLPFIMAGSAISSNACKIMKSLAQHKLDKLLGTGKEQRWQRKIAETQESIAFWKSVQKGSQNALAFYKTERHPESFGDIGSNWFHGAEDDVERTVAYGLAAAVYLPIAAFHGARWISAKGTEFSLKIKLNVLQQAQQNES